MKFVFYFFIIAEFLNILGVFAEKVKEDFSQFNPIKWEKVRENEEIPLKKIIWKTKKEKKKNRTGIILAACRTNIKTLSIHQLEGSLVIDCRETKDLLNFKPLLNKELR